MPCDSSYLEPSRIEIESKKCAENLDYVFCSLGITTPTWIEQVVKSYYGDATKLDALVILLCKVCSKLDDEARNRIMYDGRSKKARQLADWWEEHQAADRAREEKEGFGKLAQS